MKQLLLICAVVMLVGCEKTEEEEVIGKYEYKKNGQTDKLVFLDNGVCESSPAMGIGDEKWTIANGEIHIEWIVSVDLVEVFRINNDKSITVVAWIRDGKREAPPKRNQRTYKKVK